MYEALVSTAFWTVFSVFALGALIFLLGTIARSSQLTTGRAHVDDGSDDPTSTSYRIYELDLSSTTLAIASGVTFIPFGAAVVAAFVAASVLASALALALAVAAFVAADALRTRHEKLEAEFLRLSGMSVQEASDRVLARVMPPKISDPDDRPVPAS
ncbi:MAG TPA: hypothetical protein VJ694_01090 [Patescibacteria group bacterium]|nr:hypothetical protein [Patescibacteria group bacterium]